jgi:hypothetical protein
MIDPIYIVQSSIAAGKMYDMVHIFLPNNIFKTLRARRRRQSAASTLSESIRPLDINTNL